MAWIQTGSSICFKPYSLEEALRGLAAAGFENVEIGAVKDFLEHLDPDDLGPGVIAETRALLEANGLRVVSMSGHAPLHLELGRERLRRVLHAGAELGIVVLNTFTGDAESDAERASFVENVRAIADEAQELGIALCIETDSNLMPTAETGVQLLDEIGHDWVRINYDPGNVVYYAGVSPEDDLTHALPRLGHVHLKDKRGGKGVLDFPPLGEGELDIPAMLRDIRDSGFSGPVSMEIEFTNYEWPDWQACVDAARRGKAFWDSLALS
ncbi:MAG TPA: sugar phosphate isomerase/epimerase family protein [Gaiellaceae bacterium]|nr:sugar phosphate isomerase/epimerase family protein [Gaiellaceae bacterium]